MIDVIIPAYNAHETIERTLNSIVKQTILDKIKVYICNDSSKRDYSSIVKKYNDKLCITELKLDKNSGPGVARQYGIDNSNSEFIIFIDADDELYDEKSVEKLYSKIIKTDSDIVLGNFIKEDNKKKKEMGYYFVWLHGKIYKRQFLIEHNIKFNSIYPNEDVYFNRSIQLREPKIDFVESIVYIYKINKNSITRKNRRKFDYDSIFSYIDNLTLVMVEAIRDNVEVNAISSFCTSFIISIYFFYLKYHKRKNIDKVLINSKMLKNIFDEYRFKDEKLEFKIYKEQFLCHYYTYNYTFIIKPVITFEDFLKLYEIV